MPTRIIYRYRDASNYKQHAGIVLADNGIDDTVREGLIGRLQAACDADGCFVPGDVGLDGLQTGFTGYLNVDDHPWHELDEVTATTQAPTVTVPLDELVARFEAASAAGWPGQDRDVAELAAEMGTFVCTYDDDGCPLGPSGEALG